MKIRKILSIVLAVVMIVGVMPLTVSAASGSVTVADGTDTSSYMPTYPYYKYGVCTNY